MALSLYSLFFVLGARYELYALAFEKIGFDPAPWRMLKDTDECQ
jgi:hypothetical protein